MVEHATRYLKKTARHGRLGRGMLVLTALTLAACGLEQPLVNQVTEWGPDWVQDAPDPYLVRGQAFAVPGGAVEFYTGGGAHLPAYATQVRPDGIFVTEFPATTEYRNLVVTATDGPQTLLGLALRLPRARSVFHDAQKLAAVYDIGGMSWGPGARVMTNFNDRTTAITLAMLAAAPNLSAVGLNSANEALGVLNAAIVGRTGPAYTLYRQVQRLQAFAARDVTLPPLFRFPDPTGIYLNPDFVAAAELDYTGDGIVDDSTVPFEDTLREAAAEVLLSGCETGDRITVVFMVDVNEGNRDLNCGVINPFKHATNDENKQMFITGGMFTTDPDSVTPVCGQGGASEETGCLTAEEWAEVNALLGNWTPNVVPMRDDGQGGDGVAGDNVWTAVFEFPYVPTGGKNKGVRIGYKYTYGAKGAGWTGTEEWPGNNRILEIEDLNADSLVVRYDYFGDEASNKNVANLNNGLCGTSRNPWPEDAAPGCFSDTSENRIDTDGDCVPDTYPPAGAVAPRCVEAKIPDQTVLADSDYVGPGQQVVIQQVQPGSGANGGGFLVEVLGAGFAPARIADVEVNTADSGSVNGNRVPGIFVPEPTRLLFTAPPFPAATASVVVLAGDHGTAKASLEYTVEETVGCSLLYPAQMPSADGVAPAGKVERATFPVLARLGIESAAFAPELQVELGISPPCCLEGEACPGGAVSCFELPIPVWQTGWRFFPMVADAGCALPDGADLAPCADGVTQFAGTLIPDVGGVRYRYAVRYSFDYGLSWDFCDLPGDDGSFGNADGFKLSDAGMLQVD